MSFKQRFINEYGEKKSITVKVYWFTVEDKLAHKPSKEFKDTLDIMISEREVSKVFKDLDIPEQRPTSNGNKDYFAAKSESYTVVSYSSTLDVTVKLFETNYSQSEASSFFKSLCKKIELAKIVTEDSDKEYNAAAKFHADMATRKLQVPSKAKSGDIVVLSRTKDWKSDLKKIETGSVQARVIIVGKNDRLYDAAYGRIYSANETELRKWDFGFVVDPEDVKGISGDVDKIIQNTVKAIDELKEKGKI